MLNAIGSKIIVKPIEENYGALVVKGIKPTRFSVFSVGYAVNDIEEGDIIYLDKHAGAEIEHEGEKYLVIDEKMILARVD